MLIDKHKSVASASARNHYSKAPRLRSTKDDN